MVATARTLSPRMAKIAARRTATNTERANTFTVARDAYLDGNAALAEQVIATSPKGLTRTQYKQIARMLANAKRDGEALALLTKVIGESNAKHELAPIPMATLGDILRCSWGYDQTNVDFYKVVALVGTASVRIRKIGKRRVGGSSGSDLMMPDETRVTDGDSGEPGESFKGTLHRIQKGHGDGYCIRISSYSHAYVWDGEPCHETAWGYGH